MVRLYRLLEMPLAISPAVVSHAMPLFGRFVSILPHSKAVSEVWAAYSLILPSGMVIEMGSRGFFAISSSCFCLSLLNLRSETC